MYEKVNPAHPDKVADRIAGAIVDLAYSKAENPRIAVEVLIGHNECYIIAETSIHFTSTEIAEIVVRISGQAILTTYREVPQDLQLAINQRDSVKCGDNGIFKGMPVSYEQRDLSVIARLLYNTYKSDGKYIITNDHLVVCQSKASYDSIEEILESCPYQAYINPLGFWTGGLDVDTGATNRKLGSDMGDAVTGGGLHGKDLSKADVSVNIYAHLKAQKTNRPVELYCAIGDDCVDGKPFSEIVEIARKYIHKIGGFEKFAEWGLI